MDALFSAIGEKKGGLDFLVHALAFAKKEELDKAKSELCAQIPDDQGNLELATGDAWLSVTLSTVGVGAAQVAEALGGEAVKVKDFCA